MHPKLIRYWDPWQERLLQPVRLTLIPRLDKRWNDVMSQKVCHSFAVFAGLLVDVDGGCNTNGYHSFPFPVLVEVNLMRKLILPWIGAETFGFLDCLLFFIRLALRIPWACIKIVTMTLLSWRYNTLFYDVYQIFTDQTKHISFQFHQRHCYYNAHFKNLSNQR